MELASGDVVGPPVERCRSSNVGQAVSTLARAWHSRQTHAIALWGYYDLQTDGWAISACDDCLVTRLPWTDLVAISARPYRGFSKALSHG